jgi:hypothetical protein
MEQYRILHPNDRRLCKFIGPSGNQCNHGHRNPNHHLCKRHRIKEEQRLGLTALPILHMVPGDDNPIVETISNELKIKAGQKITFTISFT